MTLTAQWGDGCVDGLHEDTVSGNLEEGVSLNQAGTDKPV